MICSIKMYNNHTQNDFDFPPELHAKPLALIGASGLDTINNAVHKLIWETLSTNRRAERTPILFKLIGNAHEFPEIKPKRNAYDWYIPKGILKRNWMSKHLYEIPAVMVVFYDLDWMDSQWNEKMIECASRVQSLRAALNDRGTRIVVVLIQTTLPLPLGDDQLASELAVNLCASCELDVDSLFVLTPGDHLAGYVVRLENAFYEFAQNYYHAEIKNIRGHREHLNKTSHQYLFVRHQFKLGFIYELKHDMHTAHKHYSYAYNNLLEIRIVDTNALEIRSIAGFINYKLYRLLFALNLPRDAIAQFKTHVDKFRNRMGFQELGFEHYAWLSKQYSVFGDMFDKAVELGLPAVQTQHPGIYYQQAAQYAIVRKRLCQELCANIIAYPKPDPLEGINHMEFYGQRPWRPGKLSAEPPDPQLESNGIQALQYLEKQIAHSNIIITLYGLAISQYKTYRCPRTRRHLVLEMADEYYNSHDYGKALTLLTHMLSDFRTEAWWTIISNILEKAIRCAYLTANIHDYILLAMEILGKSNMKLDLDYKKRIHENLKRILKKQVPFGDNKMPKDILKNAIIQWQPLFTNEPINIKLEMGGNIVSCIETKARFMKIEYEVDQSIAVEIYVRNTCPLPLSFTRISVTINTPAFISEFAIDEANFSNNCLEFASNEVKQFIIEFLPDANDIQKKIQIDAINLTMGDPKIFSLELKFANTNITYETNRLCMELSHFKYTRDKLDFDNIKPLSTTLIVPRHSKLNVQFQHAQPALLGEWYEIKMFIHNNEECNINDMTIEINLMDGLTIDNNTEFSRNSNGLPEPLPLSLFDVPETIERAGKISLFFYLRAHKIGDRNIDVRISYNLSKAKPIISIKTDHIQVSVVKPFEIKMNFLSSLMTEITKFYVGEEVGIMPTIHCIAPWPVIIESTGFEFLSPFNAVDNSTIKSISNMKLQNKEVVVELFLGVCKKRSEQNVTIGHYMIKWKRDRGVSTTSQMTITGLPCEWVPLDLKLTIPAFGVVRTPLLIAYNLHNRSSQLLQLDVELEGSDGFMYAGYKKFNVSILPESVRTIQYNLYPLIAGSVALPRLNLFVSENDAIDLRQEQLNFLIERSLPTHIYVMPQVKGSAELLNDIIIKPKKTTIMQ